MKRGLTIAVAVLVVLALGAFAMTRVVRSQVFQPPSQVAAPVWAGVAPRQVSVTTADGLLLQGYYWPVGGAGDLVVVFHGNGGSQQQMAQRVAPLAAGGHGVLVASYRGYGGNPGSPTESGLFADGDAWMAKARALLPPDGRLYVFGHSLGGGVALEMAARHAIDGVATLGTFTSVADMAPAFVRPFVLDRFDNMAAIARIRAPVTLFHGTADDVVPFACAPRLRAASHGRAALVALRGAGHRVPMEAFAPMLWRALARR